MADNYNAPSGGSMFSLINIIFVLVGCVLIYYLYRALNTSTYSTSKVVVPSQIPGNIPPSTIPPFPQPFEGGDYSVNTWVYINSLNTTNVRKQVLQIQGSHFSTLLIAIGAFQNSLVVRTHYHNVTDGFQNPLSSYTNDIVQRVKNIVNGGMTEGFQPTGSDSSSTTTGPSSTTTGPSSTTTGPSSTTTGPSSTTTGPSSTTTGPSSTGSRPSSTSTGPSSTTTGPSSTGTRPSSTGSNPSRPPATPPPATPPPATPPPATNNTPNSSDSEGDLSATAVEAMFKPMASDDSILTGTPTQCDIPQIDMQRWTMVTVVLSGKTIDVYIDGKLSRSCVTSSYFKVDPTGNVTLDILGRGGFDGYLGNTRVGAYSMSPDEIYRMYLSGPNGPAIDIFSWVSSLFTGSNKA